MSDGRTLSARLWTPETDEPVPSILEYIPYRKRDVTRARDESIHAYFAARGYVSIRLDLAGSGESDGLLKDEYETQEQDDALEAISWLSEQAWCSGSVAMIGKSWGGFNALQVAARQPPALKAIVSVCSTDDRYGDDVHFMGGCLLVDGIDWGAAFQTFLPLPPDPEVIGERWRRVWEERLAGLTFPLEIWLSHQRRDEYWKHGSICEDYGRIVVPTLLVGGWVDGYKTALMRMAARLEGPTKCIIGPWPHMYPHDAVPGPSIGFLQEVIRWFDHWLKGVDNGVPATPRLRAFIQDSEPPATHYDTRRGRWVQEQEWPSPSVMGRAWHLTDIGLSTTSQSLEEKVVPFNLAVGQFGGDWGATAMPHELPPDQRYDDALSLCFESPPLPEPLEILGEGHLRLRVSADKPAAMIAARVNDVHPDGATSKVTMGLLNLAHRAGSEYPEPVTPGEWYEVEVRLGAAGYRFPPGHRIMVAISPSYWPVAWPSPEAVELRIIGPSVLELPVRQASEELEVAFEPPEAGPELDVEQLDAGDGFLRTTTFDLERNVVMRRLEGTGAYGAGGLIRIRDIGLTVGAEMSREQTIQLEGPASAATEFRQRRILRRHGWDVEVSTRVRLGSTLSEFELHGEVEVKENGERVLAREWDRRFNRDNL
jgi:predicted acyl esterase